MREYIFEHIVIVNGKTTSKMKYTNITGAPHFDDVDGMVQVDRQFTGLLDKNGVEIYEGDLVTHSYIKNEKYRCLFEGGKFQFHEISNEWIGTIHEDDLGAYCEVIGNIYENHELLI